MKLKKLFLTTGIIFTLCIAFGITVNAAAEVSSGECGTNVNWTLDSEGVLTISGEGDMTSNPWLINYSSLIKTVLIENGITSICDNAFEGCCNLKKVSIPEGIYSIPFFAFSNCSSLTSVTIPNSVSRIVEFSFSGCTSLSNITLPDSVTTIRMDAFKGTAYYNNSSNWENGVLYIGNHLIKADSTVSGKYSVKTNTKTIATQAFYNCQEITEISIPNGISHIREQAFLYCNNLKKVYFDGTQNEWEKIYIGYDNSNLISSEIIYNNKKCDILSIISPDGGTITDKTIDFKLSSNLTSVTPEFKVSDGAAWYLYNSASSTNPLSSKTVTIPRQGLTITRYVKVVAADDETVNTYTVNFYRNTKSISPVITASRDKVTITAANCDIYYTTDGSTPTTESTKYWGVFSAPSKATIKAIAVEADKDEISNVETFEVPEYLTTTMTGIECFDLLDDTCYYTIEIKSDGVPSGEFIVAIYDIEGRLIGINTKLKTIDKEETITDIVAVNGTPHTYKAFFWNSLEDLVPLCNNAEGTVIK